MTGNIAHRIGKLLADNSPAILTAVGVAGTIATAYLTGKATYLVAQDIIAAETVDKRVMDTREKFEHIKTFGLWKEYIPAAGSAALTITAILAANRVGSRRAAAMATAFAISERTLEQYRDKVREKLGEGKEQDIRDEIVQDEVRKNPPNQSTIIITDRGQVLCRDNYSGRYFESSMEDIKRAENKINYRILHDGDASLTDFYSELGIPKTSHSDEVGWNSDNGLEITFSSALTEDDKPCLCFTFEVSPVRSYY